ncbi:MAG: hypothetical protein H0U73_06340 [Tatlockia sp.]|nr:hypothetical protein [Tatlockia sp.]
MHVVLLLGSSTAGKSSLCTELVSTHGWKSISIDEVVGRIVNMSTSELKLLMNEKLAKSGVRENLQKLMTEEEILTLGAKGVLTFSKGNHLIREQQFPNPSLPDLENILIKAGFKATEVTNLAKDLRLVTEIGDAILKLYDEVFNKENCQENIVIDIVPNPDGTAQECIELFKKRAQQYCTENPNETLTTSITFAYCPVQKLSERIKERNFKAELNNPLDKRVGLFPFNQLATLVTADKHFVKTSEHTLSRNELFNLVNQHANTNKEGGSLFLENPFDPDILQPQNADDQNDLPRIGTKETIEGYSKLANRFGFFENQERASLNIREGITFDAIINTAKGDPATLANEFLEKLERNKISSKTVSTL